VLTIAERISAQVNSRNSTKITLKTIWVSNTASGEAAGS
jgi:hypothetical protein